MPPAGVIRGRPCPRVGYRQLSVYLLSLSADRNRTSTRFGFVGMSFPIPPRIDITPSATRFARRLCLEHQHEKFRRLDSVFV